MNDLSSLPLLLTTHAEGCHTWGPKHYECATARLARVESELAALRERIARAKRIATEVEITPDEEIVWLKDEAMPQEYAGKTFALVLVED